MVGIRGIDRVGNGLPARKETRGNGHARVEPWRAGQVRRRVKEDERDHGLPVGVPGLARPHAMPWAALPWGKGEAASGLAHGPTLVERDQRVERGAQRGTGRASRYRAALDYAGQAIVLDPEFWIGHMMRGQALEQLGEYERALEALTTAARFSGENSKALAMRAYVLAKTGRADDAGAMLRTSKPSPRPSTCPHVQWP